MKLLLLKSKKAKFFWLKRPSNKSSYELRDNLLFVILKFCNELLSVKHLDKISQYFWVNSIEFNDKEIISFEWDICLAKLEIILFLENIY